MFTFWRLKQSLKSVPAHVLQNCRGGQRKVVSMEALPRSLEGQSLSKGLWRTKKRRNCLTRKYPNQEAVVQFHNFVELLPRTPSRSYLQTSGRHVADADTSVNSTVLNGSARLWSSKRSSANTVATALQTEEDASSWTLSLLQIFSFAESIIER